MLKDIFHYRDLLWMLMLRDIRIRYKQAAMGFLWALFMPLVAVGAGILLKKGMAVLSGTSVDFKDVLGIVVKVLPWTFFISSTKFAVQSLVGNSNIITKIYFPRAVLPFASILACGFDFLIACLVTAVFLAVAGIGLSIQLLWLPVLLLLLFLFTSGLGLILSSANLFYRDVKYIVEIILMFGIFFTPVLYDAESMGNWKTWLLLNPVGSLLESIKRVIILQQPPETIWLTYSAAVALIVFVGGLKIFAEKEPLFAENI